MEKDKRTLLWFAVALIAVIVLIRVFGMGSYGMMGFGRGFGFIFMLLFWGLIIWLIVTLIDSNWSKQERQEAPLTLLKKRYASGEITKEEYEEMKEELEE